MATRFQLSPAHIGLMCVMGTLAAAGLVVLGPVWAGFIFAGVGIALLTLLNRPAALVLLVIAIAVAPDMSVGGVALRMEDFLMVPFVIAWLAKLAVEKTREKSDLDWILFAYVGIGFIATSWGALIGTAHIRTVDKFTSAPFHFVKRVELVLFYFILVDALRTVREITRFMTLTIGAALMFSVLGVITFLSGNRLALTPLGGLGHEPGLAALLTVALTINFLPVVRPSLRVLGGAAVLFSVGMLPLTLGRNYLMTMLIMLLYAGIFQQRWLLWCLPMLGGMTLLYPRTVTTRLSTLQHLLAFEIGRRTAGAALLERLVYPVQYGLWALGSSPVLGFGLGSVPLGFIDSEYATQLVYTGVIGLVIFIMLMVRLFALSRFILRTAPDPITLAMGRGLQLALTAYAIHSIVSPSISATRAGFFFFLVAGLTATLARALAAEQAAPRARRAGAPAPRPYRPWSPSLDWKTT